MRSGDRQAEALPERFRDVRLGLAMGDVLVHGPAFQGMEVLLQLQVVGGKEPLSAPRTRLPAGGEAGHPSSDATPGYPKVDRQPGQTLILALGQVRSLA